MSEKTFHPNRTGRRRQALLRFAFMCQIPLLLSAPGRASARSDETDFLDIPVGGRPAALGGAYSALADDSYAVNLNPGGMGFLKSTEFSGQHLSYLEAIRYDYLSFGVPFPRSAACPADSPCPGTSVGGSIQYLGSGSISATDADGTGAGDFTSHFAAYNLSFGRALTSRLSLGVTGKMIDAKISDVSAKAYAADVGTMYRPDKDVTFAAVLTNVGTKLKFLEESNPLPTALHLGMDYRAWGRWDFSTEGVYRQRGQPSAHLGVEFRPFQMLALRASYRTDAARKMGALAGVTAGMGLQFNGKEFSYAWLPLGDLGSVHYFSFNIRFNGRVKTHGGRRT